MGDEQEHNPCDAQRLGEFYERLRDYMLNAFDKAAPAYGLGVIVLRGMPAWIKAVSHYAGLESQSENNGRENIRLEPIEKTQLQQILADLLIQHCHREVS